MWVRIRIIRMWLNDHKLLRLLALRCELVYSIILYRTILPVIIFIGLISNFFIAFLSSIISLKKKLANKRLRAFYITNKT